MADETNELILQLQAEVLALQEAAMIPLLLLLLLLLPEQLLLLPLPCSIQLWPTLLPSLISLPQVERSISGARLKF
jgi:hypothetical protein